MPPTTALPLPECSAPLLASNTHITNPQQKYVYQDNITIACDNGYLAESEIISCGDNGSWTGDMPLCKGNLRCKILPFKNKYICGIFIIANVVTV